MEIKSIGHFTDIYLLHDESNIINKPDYIVVKKPSVPHDLWSNYIVFSKEYLGKLDLCKEIFCKEFADLPTVKHHAFSWELESGECEKVDCLQQDMLNFSVVLEYTDPCNITIPSTNFEFRVLETDEDWQQLATLHLHRYFSGGDLSAEEIAISKPIVDANIKRYRALSVAGNACWFGAFVDNKLVSTCGMVNQGELVRFQGVVTHPDYRQQNLCKNLMLYSINYMSAQPNRRFIIVAEKGRISENIYKKLGFVQIEQMVFYRKQYA